MRLPQADLFSTAQPLMAPTYQPPRSYGPHVTVGQTNLDIAAVLSFLVVGLGRIYSGQILKGLLILGVAILCGITIAGLVASFRIWLYRVFDACGTARRINRGRRYHE